MPCGKVNSGNFSHGTPVNWLPSPAHFGTPVTVPEPQGNVIPQANKTLSGNPVTWLPSASHFGNPVELSMQITPPIILIGEGSSGSVTVPVTDLGKFSGNDTLSYSGAPAGVTIVFFPNPVVGTGSSTATITVGSSVPVGKYTITVTGTTAYGTYNTNIHLVVFKGSGGSAFGLELENGSGLIVLENGGVILLESN